MVYPSNSFSKWKIAGSGIIFVILLDVFIFRIGFWLLPNESAWASNYFYNFVYESKVLEKKPKERFRILVIGSSIAHYSLDRKFLEEEIFRRSGKSVDVEFLSYAGMAPLDAYLMREKILSVKPDLVVYPVNFIDWRLHRAYVLEPQTGTNEKISEEKLLLDALDFQDAPQSRFVFPRETLSEFWPVLGVERSSEYAAASLFCFYRYKDLYWKILKSLYEHRFGRNTSYQEYAGVQIPERVTSRGWTGRNFSFLPQEYMTQSGFYVQVVEEILKSGRLVLKLGNSSGISQTFLFDTPGWKKILLRPEFLQEPKSLVLAELSETWVPYEAGPENHDWARDRLGVRLQETFGLSSPKKDMYLEREERIEDLRYEHLSEREYEEYFHFRLLSDPEKRPGIQYLTVLAQSKHRISRERFRPVLHFRYMKEFLGFMQGNAVPVLVVNNPENPISLSWYGGSEWYADHLHYLRAISIEEKRFLDLKDALRPNDFSDYHHFTYQAMKKMNSRYADAILKFVE